MLKLSVIVPVYNGEAYLRETVGSLEKQNYKDIEIILVDDGSDDGSRALIQVLAGEYPNIVPVFQEKNGPGGARNTGIELSLGDYIAFCDADDIVDGEIYTKLITRLEESGSDLALCDFFSERNQSAFGIPWENGRIFAGEEIRTELVPCFIGNESDNGGDRTLWGSVVRCVFKRRLIAEKSIRFPNDIFFAEDLVFLLRYLFVCSRVTILNEVLYFYRNNAGSIMNSHASYRKNMLQNRMAVIDYIESLLKGNAIYVQNEKRLAETIRGFVFECIGNACIYGGGRKFGDCYREIKKILRNEKTGFGFSHADAKCGKKLLLNVAVKGRCALLLTLYYRLRFLFT